MIGVTVTFDELIAEAEAAPIEGWDFTWLEGRATEDRPSWRYSERVTERAARASRMLDLQSGGGEMLARLQQRPLLTLAAEDYQHSVYAAARRLLPAGSQAV